MVVHVVQWLIDIARTYQVEFFMQRKSEGKRLDMHEPLIKAPSGCSRPL